MAEGTTSKVEISRDEYEALMACAEALRELNTPIAVLAVSTEPNTDAFEGAWQRAREALARLDALRGGA